jgi:hypothetical protein
VGLSASAGGETHASGPHVVVVVDCIIATVLLVVFTGLVLLYLCVYLCVCSQVVCGWICGDGWTSGDLNSLKWMAQGPVSSLCHLLSRGTTTVR